MTLEGRVALITGGGRGIGRAISLALAEDGADVAVNYRRDKEAADETVAEIRALGRRAEAVPGSVDVFEDTQSMAAAAIDALGHVDILVNNAGIASRGRSVASTDQDEVERLLRINAIGPHWLTGAVLPSMREQPRGDIVFISSIATRHHQPNGAPYNMGKAAMEALAFTLAKEERRHGIHTNIVAPGLVVTEMGRRLVKGSAGVEDIGTLDAASPYGRVCRPEDVANVVRWLVSDGASYVNGERLYVDGNGVIPG
jgi:NAD(P)-dependent dehydrogenase (short-subunit alcohol dehydrogenase family)